jgi:magnesium transporter
MFDIIPDFKNLIEKKEWEELKANLEELDSFQVSKIIEEVRHPDDVIIFRLLSRQQAKETFHFLSRGKQEKIIEGLAENVDNITGLLGDLNPDVRTAFLEELPSEVSKRLIDLLSEEEQKITTQLLGYPQDSIGRLMTPNYVAIKATFSIEQTLQHIRKHGHVSETLNVIYIVDESGKLIDDIDIKQVILASPDQLIAEIMDNRFVALQADDDQEEAVRVFQDYDRVALPVIDSKGILIGIVTVDDVMDVVEEESTEDFHKFGSIQDAIINPLKARVFHLYKKRIVWLTALVFMNVFSGAAIATFEDVIESVVALVFFLPLLIDSGGNAGAQSATLMIRSLALGDVQMKDWLKLIGKEFLVSLLIGITMAIGVALIASFRAPEIIAVVSVTMVLVVMVGSLVGMLLPMLLTKMKLDPATASAPLITSIADICGVLIYFSIAAWYFGF